MRHTGSYPLICVYFAVFPGRFLNETRKNLGFGSFFRKYAPLPEIKKISTHKTFFDIFLTGKKISKWQRLQKRRGDTPAASYRFTRRI
jgi:hypothetical protein